MSTKSSPKVKKSALRSFFFPGLGVSVKAASLADAVKIASKAKQEDK